MRVSKVAKLAAEWIQQKSASIGRIQAKQLHVIKMGVRINQVSYGLNPSISAGLNTLPYEQPPVEGSSPFLGSIRKAKHRIFGGVFSL